MTSIPSGSLPPLLPQEMASILGNSSAVQALTGNASSPTSSTSGAFLDLSPDALQLNSEQQVEMTQLEDDATLFGGTASSSPAAAALSSLADEQQYDPTQDAANPAYADPSDPTGVAWSQDAANPGYWA